MSWVWPDYIHRDLSLARQERKAIHRDAWKLWWRNRWNLALHLTFCLVGFFVLLYAADAGGWTASSMGIRGFPHKVIRAVSLPVVMIAAAIFIRAVLGRYRFAPCVYRATRQHGIDVCAECGYWLKGLNSDVSRCPECGAKREPLVGDASS
jgi:hypothetical protein